MQNAKSKQIFFSRKQEGFLIKRIAKNCLRQKNHERAERFRTIVVMLGIYKSSYAAKFSMASC